MLGDEVGQRAEPPRARPRRGQVEPGAVRVERGHELVDPAGGGTEETATTGTSRSPSERSAACRSRRARWATCAEVGLGDDEHVGDLHDPGLQELQHVAGAGLDDDRDGVGRLGHLGLGLADADGLDHHDVERGGQRLRRGARGGREPAEPLAGRGRADEQPAVGRVGLDPHAVAEQRAARALGGRVDGQHRDRPAVRAPGARERRQQRRLAGARRAGHADDVGARLAAEPRRRDLGQQRRDLVAPQPVLEQVERGGRRRQVAVAQPRAQLGAGHRLAHDDPPGRGRARAPLCRPTSRAWRRASRSPTRRRRGGEAREPPHRAVGQRAQHQLAGAARSAARRSYSTRPPASAQAVERARPRRAPTRRACPARAHANAVPVRGRRS